MKAWIVQARHPCEGYSVIRFAESAPKARYAGLNELREVGEADEYIDVAAMRTPEFDGREADPPTLRELVEHHGWSVSCDACGAKITGDGVDQCYFGEQECRENCDAVVWQGDVATCAAHVQSQRSGALA